MTNATVGKWRQDSSISTLAYVLGFDRRQVQAFCGVELGFRINTLWFMKALGESGPYL